MKHCFCLVYLAYRPGNCHMVRESKQVLDSRFHAGDFGFQALSVELGFRIPIVAGFGLLEMFSGFQSPGFRIPQAKFSPQVTDSTSKNFADSGIKIPFHWPNRGDGKTRYNTTCPLIKCCLENISVKVFC